MAEAILLLIFAGICLSLSSFFSGIETAVISSNKLRLRHLADRGDMRAHRLLRLMEYPDRIVTTLVVGNNLMNVTVSSLVTVLCLHWFGVSSEWLAALFITPVILVFGELIPKIYCRYRPDRVLVISEVPLRWATRLLSGIVWMIRYLSDVLLAVFGIPAASPQKVKVTKEELKYLLQEESTQGTLQSQERSIIARIFQFSELRVAEVMVPLAKATLLSAQATVRDVKDTLVKTGYSRYPVYDGQRNNIIGIIHVLDALFETDESVPIRPFLRPAHFIHLETPASTALVILQSRKQPMTIVVSRSRGPEGIVTIEDLLEQIVGEL